MSQKHATLLDVFSSTRALQVLVRAVDLGHRRQEGLQRHQDCRREDEEGLGLEERGRGKHVDAVCTKQQIPPSAHKEVAHAAIVACVSSFPIATRCRPPAIYTCLTDVSLSQLLSDTAPCWLL